MAKVLTKRQLHIRTLKAINASIKNEREKMTSLANELIETPYIPPKWRERENNGLIYFILDNRELSRNEMIQKLKKENKQ